ncbi:ankyrin repeat domain-containing protein [Gemmata sp. JC717]|uniref:ankyrin repeat domain-containing protein n=1 Tax=Gemmata algarum TaxID=2975278 RepID=UPI0021BA4043|nr:ankyrin repeat domain-containing protein [Gemmata algarum]MDY3555943.1 ankyrin repeat domain-containing protein [Gemmata algarum]
MTEAIWHDDRDAVVALIRSGVDPNAMDEPHWPPLFQALEHQRAEIARRLIAAGADVNRDVGQGWTPLVHAIDIESDAASQTGVPPEAVSTELVELLLAFGAEPTARAFELAATYHNHEAWSLLEAAQAGRTRRRT